MLRKRTPQRRKINRLSRSVEAKYMDFEYNVDRAGGLKDFLGSKWFEGWRDADGNDVWECVRQLVAEGLAKDMSEDALCEYVEANGLLKDLETRVNEAMF